MRGELYDELTACLGRRRPVAVATVLAGPAAGAQLLVRPGGASRGSLGSPELDRLAVAAAERGLEEQASRRLEIEHDGGTVDLFLDVHPAPPRLVIVGAVHVAVHLIEYARRLGFETIVVDPRTAFATPERFAAADRLIAEWPQEAMTDLGLDASTYLAALSHDLKIDVPALVAALDAGVRYVGALGSKKTHAKRVAALREAGVSEEAIGRIHSPIGFDLGGRRAEEIALAIMAEVVAVRYGR